jgi:rhodanese-related sulfurtransferase
MKKISLIALSLAVLLMSCGTGSSQQTLSSATVSATAKAVIPAKDFQQKLQATADKNVIDVRTPEEFASGHIKGAVNINVQASDFQTQISRLDKSKPTFVYCRAGRRSATAAEIMQQAGFTSIFDLDGGILSWEASNLPEEK